MTTLGANVSPVPESVAHSETLEDYILTCDYNLPPAYRAAQTPQLGDSYPGDDNLEAQTAPWGYIVVETGAATSRRSPDQGAYLTGVKYAKVKTPYDSGIEDLRETYRKPETGRLGRRMGTRIFLAADNDAETIAAASLTEGTPMTTAGPWSAALLRTNAIERRWRVGLAKITTVYDSRAPIGELIVINKGILEADASTVMMWNNEVVPDTTRRIGEIYFDADDDNVPKCWIKVKGNNGWPLVRANFRIHALLDSSNLIAAIPLVGAVNSNPCPRIPGGDVGKLWCNAFRMRQRKWGTGRLYDVVIGLAYDPDGWDAQNLAQLHEFDPREAPAKTAAGVATDEMVKRGSWVPVSTATTKMPISGNTASFALFDGYLS